MPPVTMQKTIVFGIYLHFILFMKNFLVILLLLPVQLIHSQNADIRILRDINIGRNTRFGLSLLQRATMAVTETKHYKKDILTGFSSFLRNYFFKKDKKITFAVCL